MVFVLKVFYMCGYSIHDYNIDKSGFNNFDKNKEANYIVFLTGKACLE